MKRILYLLLISSPIFSMQPKHINEIKQEEKSFQYKSMHSLVPLSYTATTIVPTMPTWTTVFVGAAKIGISMAITAEVNRRMMRTTEQDSNK